MKDKSGGARAIAGRALQAIGQAERAEEDLRARYRGKGAQAYFARVSREAARSRRARRALRVFREEG